MGCCVALAYLVALVRRAWFSVVPGEPATAPAFAPPARRPAPGGIALAVSAPTAGRPIPHHAAHTLVVAGLAWFALGLVGMHVLGWFSWAQESLLTDTAFHASGLWLAAAGVASKVVRA